MASPLGRERKRSAEQPFEVRDCTLIAMTTGLRAQNLKELLAAMSEVPESSIYHHFWGRLMWPRFDEPEFSNDFASWVRHALHEKELAERLSVLHPSDFNTLQELREELIDILEDALDGVEQTPWARAEDTFNFVQAQMVVFDRSITWRTPQEMASGIESLSLGGVYYHFIDARMRTDEATDDFSLWLMDFGPECVRLAESLRQIDPFFSSLAELRREIVTSMQENREELPA